MDGIREYLMRVTVAALCCGIISSFLGKKGSIGLVIKFLCGLFMAVVLISPLISVRLDSLEDIFDDISTQADVAAGAGEAAANHAYGDIIKEKVTAYILDKAESFGAVLTVEVTLDGSVPPVPCAVRIEGQISPYGKSVLSDAIAGDLGIRLEDQIWIG